MIKVVKEQKKSQLKYYQMVLYTLKNILPMEDRHHPVLLTTTLKFQKTVFYKNNSEGTRQNRKR